MSDEAITYTYIDTNLDSPTYGCPVIVYRASAVGGCISALVASRLGMDPAPTPDKAQAWFQRGHEAEIRIKEWLVAKGWEITQEQEEVELVITPGGNGKPRIIIRGHIDGVGRNPSDATIRQLLECKRMAKDPYDRWVKDGRVLLSKDDPLRKRYLWQTSIYCHSLGLSGFRIAVETDGQDAEKPNFDIGGWETPYYSVGQIRARILGIERMVREGTVPTCDLRSFPCPYYYLHEDKPSTSNEDISSELGQIVEEIVAQQVMKKGVENNIKELQKKALKLMEQSGHGNVGSKARINGVGSIAVMQSTTTDYKRLIADYNVSNIDTYKSSGAKFVKVTAASDS